MVIGMERDILESIKRKCSEKEKRSLTAQIRKLIEVIPDNDNLLQYYRWKLRYGSDIKDDKIAKTAIKIPESEYWALVQKAAKGFMSATEFIILILELWKRSDLVTDIYDASETASSEGKPNQVKLSKIKNDGVIETITVKYAYFKQGIEISWKADHYFPGELWIVFIKNSTNEILGEFFLGRALEGSQKFSSKELGFDEELGFEVLWKEISPKIIEKEERDQ